MKQRAVEKYYTVQEIELLVCLSDKTIIKKIKAGEFGHHVVDLAKAHPADEPASHDYRVPASALNAFLENRRVFYSPEELGIAARTEGELRRLDQQRKAA